MLQESTADGFENTASYCGFTACISYYIFLCTVVLGCCAEVFFLGGGRGRGWRRGSHRKKTNHLLILEPCCLPWTLGSV